VHYESFEGIRAAIKSGKLVKGRLRTKKVARIESVNRACRDLAEDFASD
jgi:predicted GIY-YIG superfamily endonuclease